MRYRLLGPFEIQHDERLIRLGGPRLEKAIAALLLEANRVVPVGRLVDVLWDCAPPANAVKQARNCVSLARAAFSRAGLPPAVATAGSGYRLTADEHELDVLVFRAHLGQAQQFVRDGLPDRAAERLRDALSLWRGPVLAGWHSQALLPFITTLNEQRVAALEQHAELELQLGRSRQLVVPLTELVAEYPLREQLVCHLMLALYRCGRRADALAAYGRLRERLDRELGITPSREAAELHGRILRTDPALHLPVLEASARPPDAGGRLAPRPEDRIAPRPASRAVPRQLPAVARHFTGRKDELAALNALLDQSGRGRDPAGLASRESPVGTVVISAIDGTAGIGKTALAVYWAQHVADRFPDGQLYVDLRGFDPSGRPVAPAEAVRIFLDALTVPGEQIPVSLDAQVALYRSLLAGNRMLIVLDNARDAEQVRPLLPGGPACLTVVTSRRQLTSLVASAGAQPLTLDVLTDAEASELLARRLGAGRVAAEPDAAAELIESCARLPLALSIVAARAAADRGPSIAVLAAQLRDVAQRLDQLDAGDATTNARAVFSWSYEQLTDLGGRMFRLLGLHPGPDISLRAAASLAGIPVRQATEALGELTRANLLNEHAPGRFAFHDLLRAYAAAQARDCESDGQRRAALHRVLDYYLHTGHAAALQLSPVREPLSLTPPQPGVLSPEGADDGRALAWFEAEHRVLMAAVAFAAETGFGDHAWQITWTIASYLDQRGHWPDLDAIQRIGLAAAERLGQQAGQAHSHYGLSRVCLRLGQHEACRRHLHCALDLYQQIADRPGQAHTRMRLGWLFDLQGRHEAALSQAQQALDLFRATGNRAGEASALNNIGWCYAQAGDFRESIVSCRKALALQRETGNRRSEAATLDSLGYAHHRLGLHEEAVASYAHAIELRREIGDRCGQAGTLTHIGDAWHDVGNLAEAGHAWQQALAILDDLCHPDAHQVRAKLRDVGTVTSRLRHAVGSTVKLAWT